MNNARIFAKALFALYQAGVLKAPECKGAVKTFIRQTSEDTHWHVSTHYRSKEAAKIIAAAKISSKAQYQMFCKKRENNLRHEHMVPGSVIYELIISHKSPSVDAFFEILDRTRFRATITKSQDDKLPRNTVPDLEDFRNPQSSNYLNHMIRYIHAKLEDDLEPCPPNGWYQEQE